MPPEDRSGAAVQTGQRPVAPTTHLALGAERSACGFSAGAMPTDTLPISQDERAEIPIRHVVILMKENRSFDHLLGDLNSSGQAAVSAVPATFANPDASGATVPPFPLTTTCLKWDPGHQWDAMHAQVDGGAMDGFVTSAAKTTKTDGHFVMGHYQHTDLPFYNFLANTFAIDDRHFSSVRSGTWPNRLFLLLGTADGVKCSYCGGPNPATPTIFDALDAAGDSWGAYADGEPFDGALGWSAPHAGLHPFADFLTALRKGTLPSVAFVDGVPNMEDEHPPADVQAGEAWTRRVYEAAVASPLWPEIAIIWTYDEGGGFADDVPPPDSACVARPDNPLDTPFVELGVRVPFAVISPYARFHYVSHVVHEHTAITRFIELVFNLPALTARDANSDALLDMFDFDLPALLVPPPAPGAGTGGCPSTVPTAPP
jgi:phospholipase C